MASWCLHIYLIMCLLLLFIRAAKVAVIAPKLRHSLGYTVVMRQAMTVISWVLITASRNATANIADERDESC